MSWGSLGETQGKKVKQEKEGGGRQKAPEKQRGRIREAGGKKKKTSSKKWGSCQRKKMV